VERGPPWKRGGPFVHARARIIARPQPNGESRNTDSSSNKPDVIYDQLDGIRNGFIRAVPFSTAEERTDGLPFAVAYRT
jgi:hypothetical protein